MVPEGGISGGMILTGKKPKCWITSTAAVQKRPWEHTVNLYEAYKQNMIKFKDKIKSLIGLRWEHEL